jgi:cytochrome c biogenesis protein CcmG/thiol:disulfide interchange protein DsbE
MKISVVRTKSTSRFWLCALSLLLFCGSITAARPQPSEAQLIQQAGPKPGPAVGRAAIAFNLQTFDGKPITLETLRGKPFVLNFFASWCDPCRDEMPLINELAARGDKEGYRVLGVAVEDTRAAVTEYSKEANLLFPIALDLNNTVKRSYRIFGPPATFFVDSQGVIRDIVLGPITRERALEALKNTGVIAKN